MILGIGSDMVHIDRIEALMDRFKERFEKHVYTEVEVKGLSRFSVENKRGRAAYLARRFAAKEAFSKALGTGFRNGLIMRDIGIYNDMAGKPHIELSGQAKTIFDEFAKGRKLKVHISLSDDYPLAQAFVVISRVV